MSRSQKIVLYGSVAALCGFISGAVGQEVTRLLTTNPASPYSEVVGVPPGYMTYYVSGSSPTPVNPDAPRGSPQRMGDTVSQTRTSLVNLKKTLAGLGLNFGNVVEAHVFLAGDPAKDGEMDFAGMNQEWLKEFGTSEQPNKPARSTIKVGLATPGKLVEIEMIAVKRVQ